MFMLFIGTVSYRKHKDIFILLLSAKAGGVGLNVTGSMGSTNNASNCRNHVYNCMCSYL